MWVLVVFAGAGRSEAAGPADLVAAGAPPPPPVPAIPVYAGEPVELDWHAPSGMNLRTVAVSLAAVGGAVVAVDLPVEAESERLDAAGAPVRWRVRFLLPASARAGALLRAQAQGSTRDAQAVAFLQVVDREEVRSRFGALRARAALVAEELDEPFRSAVRGFGLEFSYDHEQAVRWTVLAPRDAGRTVSGGHVIQLVEATGTGLRLAAERNEDGWLVTAALPRVHRLGVDPQVDLDFLAAVEWAATVSRPPRP